jgi:hypothetical protein
MQFMRRLFMARTLIGIMALALAFMLPAAGVRAQEEVSALPPVTNFTSARFDLLVTTEVAGEKQLAYGSGTAILPDRAQLTLYTPPNNTAISVVQIGATFYINTGTGWQRSDDLPLGNVQSQPVSEQLAALQEAANGIVLIGEETVRGAPASHYQLWVSGANVLELGGAAFDQLGDDVRALVAQSTYKYDLWIGRDGRLLQQNSVALIPETTIGGEDVPATTSSTLITYYDFDSPGISIDAPIQ